MDSPFHQFCGLVSKLNPHDDSIVLEQKLKYLASDINDVVEGDESNLESALMCFNERALEDNDFAINFAMLFTSHYFDGLREHLQSPDGNSAFREHILNMLQRNHSNAEKLKTHNIIHFYNSITLLGEFYHRLHKKSQPVAIVGRSLFDLLAREVRNETINCTNDSSHIFDVQFARLLLTQVTINGLLAKTYHQHEIEALFFEVRKCLIQVLNLTPATKTFLLMSLDLYYSDFKSLGHNLEKFYGKYLDEHDTNERNQRPQIIIDAPKSKDTNTESSNNGGFSLRNLAKDFANLKASVRTNGGQDENRKINPEYLNRPLKASDRLKYFQNSNSSLSVKSSEDNSRSQSRLANDPNSDGSGQNIASNNNDNKHHEQSSNDAQVAAQMICVAVSSTDDDKVSSPEHESDATDVAETKLETFDWFEAVQREEEFDESNSVDELNHSGGSGNSHRFDRLSVISQDGVSSHSSQPSRSRRNSLNRFRSDSYRQSTEDLYQNDRRSMRNDSKSQQHYLSQSWRNSDRQSPRHDQRNGYNKRPDYERDRERDQQQPPSTNGRHNEGNYNRRNLVRGGSVDSKSVGSRNRHDSFNRRQQDSDNFEHFQSYNRKTYSRNKDSFMQNRTLPPRLQQKLQQQRQEYNNDCDNPKRYNNRNNTNSTVVGGRND